MKNPKHKQINTGRGYAWLCDFGLCYWAEPDIVVLKERSQRKPSPEAVPVAVRIIRERDYLKLKRAYEKA